MLFQPDDSAAVPADQQHVEAVQRVAVADRLRRVMRAAVRIAAGADVLPVLLLEHDQYWHGLDVRVCRVNIAEAVLGEAALPNVELVGPFTYQMQETKWDISWNDNQSIVYFRYNKTFSDAGIPPCPGDSYNISVWAVAVRWCVTAAGLLQLPTLAQHQRAEHPHHDHHRCRACFCHCTVFYRFAGGAREQVDFE